ncbi:MAG: GNAT family N-acetyltransferase [Bdellovibrionales bacterium]|nr:GNAT family N-acetyltransferase [Bdellovibrionales bacterium]
MKDITFVKIQNREELERCFPVMKELRPHLNVQEYLEIYRHAHAMDGYEILAMEQKGEIIAVMGYRILYDFVRGRHLYIDDLVSTEKMRSQGLGGEMLKQAEVIAKDLHCKSMRLCAVLENDLGIKFYEKHHWTKRAYAFTKKVP